jgi:hypothetical protein
MVQNDQALLLRLKESGLDFVVIGGVCAVYHGALLATFDLDICCPFGLENVEKIEKAIGDLHPIHRLTANKLPLEKTRDVFPELKNLYLQTDLGKLDCLSEVAGIGGFDEVSKQSVVAQFSYGEIRFLNFNALIAAKKATGRAHDLTAIRHLLALQERHDQQKNL